MFFILIRMSRIAHPGFAVYEALQALQASYKVYVWVYMYVCTLGIYLRNL